MKTKHGILEVKTYSLLAGFAIFLLATMFTLASCGGADSGISGGDDSGPLEIPANMLGEWKASNRIASNASIKFSNNDDNIGIINWNYNVVPGYTHWGDSRVMRISGGRYSVVGGSYSVTNGVVTGGNRAVFDAMVDHGFLLITNSTPTPSNGVIWCGPDPVAYYQEPNRPAEPVLTGVIVANSESDANSWTQASSFTLGSKIYFAIECSDFNDDITSYGIDIYKGTSSIYIDRIYKDIGSPFKGYLGYIDTSVIPYGGPYEAGTDYTIKIKLYDFLYTGFFSSDEVASNTFALTN
jgi:hypothetical protein